MTQSELEHFLENIQILFPLKVVAQKSSYLTNCPPIERETQAEPFDLDNTNFF
jgi:hypothetical protein